MGKTKTSFVSENKQEGKSSEQAYREKKERQAAAASAQASASQGKPKTKAVKQGKEKQDKIHVAGLKGGQRVKMIGMEEPETKEQKNQGTEEPASAEAAARQAKAPKIRGKKYKAEKAKVTPGKTYPIKEALALVKDTSYSKFDGTVELHLIVKKTGLSANVTLPYRAGKSKKVVVANDEILKQIQDGKIDFDVLLATAEMMPKLVPFAKVLGPKGLMPNPKNGTLIKSEKEADKFSVNSLSLRTEKEAPLIHTVVGKVSQKDEELIKNIEAIMDALGGSKQIVKAYMKSTMGPSVRVQIS